MGFFLNMKLQTDICSRAFYKIELGIYPNPTFANLTIERTFTLNCKSVLFDCKPRLVIQGKVIGTNY
jgi:hypothetical protein